MLRIVLNASELSSPYRGLTKGQKDHHDIGVCTFFRPTMPTLSGIRLFAGDGTLRGFFKTLRQADEAGPWDIVHAHSPHVGLLLLLSPLLRCPVRARRLVFTAHYSFTNSNLRLRNRLMLLPVFALYDAVVCVGAASYESFPRVYRWLSRDRLRIIRNGVDTREIDGLLDGAREKQLHAPFTILSVGRLIPLKDPMCVLDAAKSVTGANWRLVFVGGGHLEPQLRRIAEAGSGRLVVEFRGVIRREEVYEAMAEADVFVSASRGEGLPIAVLEAMACNCPVVLSDIPSHREIADGAAFVPLVQPSDPLGLAKELRRLAALSRDELQEVGVLCRGLVERRFALESTIRAYENLYHELLQRPARGEWGFTGGRPPIKESRRTR